MPPPEHGDGHATARVHHACRWCSGCVENRRACAAARTDAPHQCADGSHGGRSGIARPPRGVCHRVSSNRVGLSVKTSALNTGGPTATPIRCANTRQNWSPSPPTSSSRIRVPPSRRCYKRPGRFRSCSLVADPVGGGYVNSLASPGGNVTGFTNFEYSMGGKWLEFLKEIAPNLTRTAVLRESAIAAGPGQFGAIAAVASALGVELRPIDVRDPSDIERDITTFAQNSNGGLIVTGSPAASVHRDLIIGLAARHRLPAVYNSRLYVTMVAYSPMGLISSISSGARPATSIASSRVKSPPTCRCRRRPSTNWRSISRRQNARPHRGRKAALPSPTR